MILHSFFENSGEINLLGAVKEAKIGSIVPVYKEIYEEIDALEYFGKVSDYGRKKNSILFEDKERSIGTANPCLMVVGKDIDFEIIALNNLGKKFLSFIKKDFKFCDKAVYHKDKIYGKLTPARRAVSEEERLKLKNHIDIIRTIAFKFKPTSKPFANYCGLFGMISYDFANQIEDLPNNSEDILKDPDYVLYFLDNMFIVDHKTKKTYFVANALVTDNNREKIYSDCNKIINNYEKFIGKKTPKGKKPKKKELKLDYDFREDEFLRLMENLKRHILDGEVLYAAPSRMVMSNYNAEPLDIYAELKNSDSDNYTFYIIDKYGISIGCGADAILNVNGEEEKTVELRILTNTIPRGTVKGEIEKDYDNKYEALLKVDENEMAYYTMLVDALRNDVARISQQGTRYVDKLFVVDKQAKFQTLTSSVKCILNKDFDALHAYTATMNPAVISGIPKMKAMQVLRKIEKGKRCFNSGSLLYASPDKDLCSITIEPIRIKKDNAYIRTSFRVFHNSDDKEEFNAGNEKTMKFLDAIKSAGGLK